MHKPTKSRILSVTACLMLLYPAAIQADEIPQAKQTKLGLYLTAAEARDVLSDEATVFIDIRSRAEVAFLGLPSRVNVHIPYMTMPMVPEFDSETGSYPLEINPDFPLAFMRYAQAHNITADTPIILMCRSGNRSAKAADLLAEMGFNRVYSLIDGFEGDTAKTGPDKGHRVVNGWKNVGLDWSYKIREDQAYPDDKM